MSEKEKLSLKVCCNQLLDLGKRNRLLYFKEANTFLTLSSHLSDDDLLKSLLNENEFHVYDFDKFMRENDLSSEAYNASEKTRRDFIEEAKENYQRNHNKNLLFLTSKRAGLKQALKRIVQAANSSINERGINILYLSIGMLNWYESDESNELIHSPLLLVPLSTERQGASNDFNITINLSDDIQINATLAYKLKQNFTFVLPTFDIEHDTVESYMEAVEKVASNCQRWSVSSDKYIGLFAFSKIDMYRDLMSNENAVLSNKIIQSIFNGENPNSDQSLKTKEKAKIGPLHNVVDADSSQIKAIKASKNSSFVLEGPPGTGKSQTITNIIAEALCDGRSVLFVSEKKAALDVVYKKLQQVGLSDFCLSLHGNKANKKSVLENIDATLSMNRAKTSDQAADVLNQLKAEQDYLNSYVRAINKTYPILEMSAYQVLGLADKYADVPAPFFCFSSIEYKGKEFLHKTIENLRDLLDITKNNGRNLKGFPLLNLKKKLNFEEKIQFQKVLKNYIDYAEPIEEKILSILDLLQYTDSIKIKDLDSLFNEIHFLESNQYLSPSLFEPETRNKIKRACEKLKLLGNAKESQKQFLLEICKDEALSFKNAAAILGSFKTKYKSFFRNFSSSYKKSVKALTAISKQNRKLTYEECINVLERVLSYQSFEKNYQQCLIDLNTIAESPSPITETNLSPFSETLEKADTCTFLPCIYLSKLTKSGLNDLISSLKENELTHKEEDIIRSPQSFFDPKSPRISSLTIRDAMAFYQDCYNNLGNWETTMRLTSCIEIANQNGYSDFVYDYLKGDYELEEMCDAFLKCFYEQHAHHIIENNPVLQNGTRLKNDSVVREFQKNDKLSFKISQAQIKERCSQSLPNEYDGGIVASFKQQANKKRRLIPIRQLMEKYGSIIQQIKPCFMMSPLSVSTYLSSNIHFDLVVFDEASQVFPWDALGAIYRSNHAIIVGDNKQMPPTSFFMAEVDDSSFEDESLEESDVSSFESILDYASSFPHYRLLWHYRSKTENLIEFSNKHFYQNSLITFPSSSLPRKGFGVDFYYVQNGIYNRQYRLNENEAQFVVDLIVKDVRDFPNDSLGVVCMNISQQEEIENLLETKAEEDPILKDYIYNKKQDSLFVKNLETVQGDERDRIILSIGYARDTEGKFYHSFGPLNRQGGERRLNVAITRSKLNVQVVSSIHYYDIKEENVTSKGAILLKGYLEFAENGGVTSLSTPSNEADTESPFEEDVYQSLISRGYRVDKQVGCSGYRIDFGIRHPNKDEYILAVECDGASYHSSSFARDRDRLRQEILESQGWKFYRIWSTDWFSRREEEKRRLFNAIEDAISKRDFEVKIEQDSSSPDKLFEIEEPQKTKDLKDFFAPYQERHLPLVLQQIPLSKQNEILNAIRENLHSIVYTEQPICEEYLLQKLAKCTGRDKVTQPFKQLFLKTYRYCSGDIKHTSDKYTSYYYISDCSDCKLRIKSYRLLSQIPGIEIQNGLTEIVKQLYSVTEDDLIHQFCFVIGYQKVSQEMYTEIQYYINKLKTNGTIVLDSSGLLQLANNKVS